eukprot:TCONS_00067879-protein
MYEDNSQREPLLAAAGGTGQENFQPQQQQQNGFFGGFNFGQYHQYPSFQTNGSLNFPAVPGSNLPQLSGADLDFLPTEPPDFIIDNAVFPKEICKKQQRKKEKMTQMVKSVQRINCDDIKLNIILQTTTNSLEWVDKIDVIVHNHYKNIRSEVQSSWRNFNRFNTIRLEFSLNDAIDHKVFDLPKSPDKEKKKFSYLITIKYKNVSKTVTKETDSFYLIGTDNKRQSSGSTSNNEELERQIKRTKSDSFNSVSSGDSGVGYSPSAPSYEGNNNGQQQQQQQQSRILDEYSRIITDRIETKTLSLNGTEFDGTSFKTERHDIGYHFELGDDDGNFEEGEVVGLSPIETYDADVDQNSIQKLAVVKLTNQNAKDAILKGVVTKAPYIEAYCPKKNSNKRTIIICMMGIVPVQVIGSVRTNEFLYAAPNNPGFAVGDYDLGTKSEKNEATFIGVAFNSRLNGGGKTVGIVEAGVSLMQAASQHLVNEKLRDMETSLDHKIERVNKSAIRWRKCFCGSAILFGILLGLLGIFLWQKYTPGSAYKKWKCRKGHKEPFQTAIMNYIPNNSDQLVETYGIEFTLEGLRKKIGHSEYKPIPEVVDGIYVGKNPHYMLGFYRCAYGNAMMYETESGKKIYRGPESFVVDEKCQHTFYHHDRKNIWVRYLSVNAITDPTTLVCNPALKSNTTTSRDE